MEFRGGFQFFVDRYAHHDKNDRHENKKTMEWKWTIADDFPIIAKRIDDVLPFAELAEAPISNHKAVDAGMKLIMNPGLFKCKYKE